jgi:nicotinate dehydrogenase subunit B
MADAGLNVYGSIAPGYPASQTGYGARAYGNTEPELPKARWLLIRPNGKAVVFAGKVEYGQNIRTGLAIEVADELRIGLDNVEVVLADTDSVPWDMGTFGSQSTARVGLQLRKAAATARELLLQRASDRLDLPVTDLDIDAGTVFSRSDRNHAASYADLIDGQAIECEISDDVPLTERDAFQAMGADQIRIDAEARVTGKAVYAQDVQLPDMLFARILRPPAFNATLVSVDLSPAEAMPGVVQTVNESGLIAVLADDDEAADRALSAVTAEWDGGAEGSHLDIPTMLLETAQNPMPTQESGDLEAGFREADHKLEATYYVPHVSNMPMEPRAAVASWEGDRLTVWAGTQRPFGLRSELAQHFRLPEDKIRIITPEIGGAFGTKSWFPAGLEAARLARIASRPVRVAYTRQEDTVEGTVRPAAVIEIKSGFRSDGTITAWQFNAYHAGPFPHIASRGSEIPYDVDNVSVTVHAARSLLRVGSYRSLGGAVNHFGTESHIDEIAAALGQDPVEFRLRNLSHSRFRGVLEAAAEGFGWKPQSASNGRGFGVAIGTDVGSFVGTCLELDVARREVRTRRIVSALDCGLTVNPEGARNQMEGSTVMGLGTALYEAIEVRNGVLLNPTFTRYQVPRMNSTPEIEVLLKGDPEEPSTGAGEPGIVTVAPAVANAIYDATGQRIRELPLQRQLS